MANNRSDVNLVITAKNEASKTIEELEKSLVSMGKSADGKPLNKLSTSSKQLREEQQKLSEMLSQVREKSTALGKGAKSTNADILSQKNAIDKLRDSLATLKTKYQEAGSQQLPRRPTDASLGAVEKQIEKREKLTQTIAKLRSEIEKTAAAFKSNGGIDEKAQQNIAKYEDKVKELGKSWREATTAVGDAKRALQDVGSRKSQIDAEVKAQEQKVKLLREEAALAYKLRQKPARDFDGDTKDDQKAAKEAATKAHKELSKQRDEAIAELAKYKAELKSVSVEEKAASKVAEKATETVKKRSIAYKEAKAATESFKNAQQTAGYDRQNDSIEKSRATLVKLEEQLKQTQASYERTQAVLKRQVSPSAKSVTDQQNLKVQIQEVEKAIIQEVESLNRLEKEFDDAGVSAAQLAAQQERLDRLTTSITKKQKLLAVELDKVSKAGKRAAEQQKKFSDTFKGNGSRQSLSFLQRIRGELLAIAATFTGIYAVGGGIKSIYDAAVLTQKATSRLSAKLNGDMDGVRKEIAYVRAEADRLGLEFETLLEQYSKFAVNVPNSSLSLEQIRFSFSGIAEAARVVGLSTDDVNATFRALSQIASKGSVQLEELKGQLGERIPKAIELTAKGLSEMSGELITTEELLKKINDGDVTSDTIVALAGALKDEFGSDLPQAMKSAQVGVAGFKNALYDLKILIIESGFMDELIKSLTEVTRSMQTPEFRDGALALTSGFSSLLEILVKLIEHADLIGVVIATMLGAKALSSITRFSSNTAVLNKGLGDISVKSIKAKNSVDGLGGAFNKLALILKGVFVAFTAGFAIGEFLNSFDIVRKTVINIQALLFRFAAKSTEAFSTLWIFVSNVFAGTLSKIPGEIARLESETKKELDQINDITSQMLDEFKEKADKTDIKILDPKDARHQAEIFSDEISKGLKFYTTKSNFKGLETAFKNILDTLQDESAETLSQQLAVIESEYTEFLEDLAEFDLGSTKQIEEISRIAEEKITLLQSKIDSADNNDYRIRLEKQIGEIQKRQAQEINRIVEQRSKLSNAESSTRELIELRKKQKTQEFYDDQTEKAQTRINDIIGKRAEEIEKVNTEAEVGLVTTQQQGEKIDEINDKYLSKIRLAIVEAERLAEATGNQELLDFTANLSGYENVARLKSQIAQQDRETANAEESINDLISARSEELRKIDEQRDAQLITTKEQGELINKVNDQFLGKIKQAIIEAEKLAKLSGNQELLDFTKTLEGFEKVAAAKAKLEENDRQTASFEKDINDLLSERARIIDLVNQKATLGISTTEEQAQALRETNDEYLVKINEILVQARELATVTGNIGLQKSLLEFEGFGDLEKRKADLEQLAIKEKQINDLISIRDSKVAQVNAQIETGQITRYHGEAKIRDLMNEENLIIKELVVSARDYAASIGETATVEAMNATINSMSTLNEEILNTDQVAGQFASGLTSAIDSFIFSTKSASEAFKQFIASFLRQIANAIIQALILKAIMAAINPVGAAATTGAGAAVGTGTVLAPTNHRGGIVGKDATEKRRISPLWFLNAARYHSGGIAGLKPDEVPTILQRGEQVIPKNQVTGAGTQQPAQSIKIVNAIDSASVVEEGMRNSGGQKAIMNFFRANKSQIKSVLA